MVAKKAINDPFGAAAADYYNSLWKIGKHILVESTVSGKEKIKVSYLFRGIKDMPELEKKALELCSGKTLDVGACVGSHALELQKKNMDVTALEISSTCASIMTKRGVKKVVCADIFNYAEEQFDTILLLMNGIGLSGDIEGLKQLLSHLRRLLKPHGQIIFDSSDIDYIYFEEDGSKWVDLNNEYYGQVKYTMSYKKIKAPAFKWLFIDAEKMREIAVELDFKFTLLAKGNHYDYLGLLNP
jgi:SAM-dependent methyltransferase